MKKPFHGLFQPGTGTARLSGFPGFQALAFIFPDGREAVYDGDTGRLITDPRYAGTYNYVTPGIPSWNPLTWPETRHEDGGGE
ncbi:MAG: hypothetical protein HZA24_12145 [Nitrospirae bacterium]|nr:hypothetical protein [Nitrospirota bacterium]